MTVPMARAPYTDGELVRGYLASFEEGDDGDGTNFWATEELMAMVSSDPERAWRLTLEMLRSVQDALFRAYVAAGPLEDLLCNHGSLFIERVEALAKTEPWFLESLRTVYGHIRMQPEIYARVQQALDSNA